MGCSLKKKENTMIRIKHCAIIPFCVFLISFGCSNENPNAPDENGDEFPYLIGGDTLELGNALKISAELFAGNLWLPAGATDLLLRFSEGGTTIQLDSISVQITMEMRNGMMHGTPIDTMYWDDQLHAYRLRILWVMPNRSESGDTLGIWRLIVRGVLSQEILTFEFFPQVFPSPWVQNFHSMVDSSIVFSFFYISKAQLGINECLLWLYRKQGENFLPIDNWTVVMDVSMPSMGHGSPNNIAPKFERRGRYRGQVNFTMYGEWLIAMSFSDELSQFVGSVEYTVSLP